MPWLMIVDSRATTGLPSLSAFATSGEIDKYLFICDLIFVIYNRILAISGLTAFGLMRVARAAMRPYWAVLGKGMSLEWA